jgi:sulfotransferase family protein
MNAPWPNLFVVGAPKAGTTSLWLYLDRHPEIWMAPVKEPQFFSGVWYDEDSYLRLFAPGARFKLRGEASPSYLANAGVAEAIKRVSPDARIVIMLRDPVERAYSKYSQEANRGVETRPFSIAVEEQIEEPAPDGRPSAYVGSSFYADAVSRYLQVFPARVHVIVSEEFARDTRSEVRKVFEFLGVDAGLADRLDMTVSNAFSLPRSGLGEFVQHSRRIRTTGRRVIPRALYPLAQRLLLKRSHKPPMEPEVEALLTAYFAPDVERLRAVLGRDLPWARFVREAVP